MADPAPLFSVEGARPPEGGAAFWLRTSDKKRLRAAYWPEGRRGTVLLYPGRTEFIEKHYEPIARFQELGFAISAIDWRGQGLSDRALADRRKGHVEDFAEFQRDVDAWMAELTKRNAPKPWIIVAHSMGGAIAARSLMRQASPNTHAHYGGALPARIPVATMTAPMLGIEGVGGRRSAFIAAQAYAAFGWLEAYVPGPKSKTMTELGFEGNGLTHDRQRFAAFSRLVEQHDELALGAATWGWLLAARRETRLLKPTATPMTVFLGEQDTVVSTGAIKAFVRKAPKGELVLLQDCWHEPFMETDRIQKIVWSKIPAFLDAHGL